MFALGIFGWASCIIAGSISIFHRKRRVYGESDVTKAMRRQNIAEWVAFGGGLAGFAFSLGFATTLIIALIEYLTT